MPRLFVLALTLLMLALPASAQRYARPDDKGDYFLNTGPVQGKVATPAQAGGLWKVVATRAEGHARPDAKSPVVKTFARGTLLQADVGRGGSDEVNVNAPDADGNPWMRVRDASGKSLGCYVRANVRVIKPVQPPKPEPVTKEENSPFDSLRIGDNTSERAHHLSVGDPKIGETDGQKWLMGSDFNFSMQVTPYDENDLILEFVQPTGVFDVLVNKHRLTTTTFNKAGVITMRYRVPARETRFKQSISVTLRAHVGAMVAPLTGAHTAVRP